MTVIIDVINDSASTNIPGAVQLQTWGGAVLKHLDASEKPVSLGLRIVDEDESAAINLAYRQKDYATNVLSFAVDIPDEIINSLDEVPLGDLVICASVVAREADAQEKSLPAHWAHMLIHGMLHLHGFDHETDAEALAMETLETQILAELGFENPYKAEQHN
ncbi:rRNA maturation RNase YbeY [Gammaproteobacteria bacterium LSUCC0112]|nr:rRNA maturation RNase YbeY [Gammaproteobacteria bacterium LSUCC0112]